MQRTWWVLLACLAGAACGGGGSGVDAPPGGGGDGPGGGGDGGGTGVWRPFADTSPWNARIGADPALDPDNDALIADWATSSPFGPHLDINMGGFSIPRFEANATTPRVLVSCELGGFGFDSDEGFNATATIPIPADAMPDPQSDHHLLIIDREAELEWGMWNTSVDGGGAWRCGLGASMDLTGSGVRPIANGNPTWYTSHGPRACGFPLVAGLIRPEEIEAGRIEHALVVAYPHIRAGWYTPPASTAQARIGDDSISTRGIPCGGRIQLDPTIDVDALAISDSAKVVARALQEYGAYVGDYSGAMSLYADNSAAAMARWDELDLDDYALGDEVALTAFRVLALGTLYDNGNGD
jgi:hypothetical protein